MSDERTRASLALLFEISRELTTTLDLRTILMRVLTLSVKNVDAERASIIIVDDDLHPVDAAIIYGDRPNASIFERLGDVLDSGLAGWVAKERETAWLADTSKDERWLKRPDDDEDQSGAKSAICVPLLADSQLMGVLTIVHPVCNYFARDHVDLVQGIADIAALAVKNARLYASLQLALRRYRDLFEESIDPIFITNWQGGMMDANRQAETFTGFNKEELIQQMITDLFGVPAESVGVNYVDLLDGRRVNFSSEIKRKNETVISVDVHVHRIDYSGTDALQWILHDISERVELDRMREDLTAMIYHDLRSPLANIVSSLDLLGGMLPEENEANIAPVMAIANRSVERLQRLINSLLDINRLEAGQAIANRQKVHPEQLVLECAEIVHLAFESKQQILVPVIATGIPELVVDVDMIRRVLINLLENANKFSPSGSELEIGVSNCDSCVSFWVKDDGPGIPVEAQEAIFDKFTRLQSTRSSKGLGLGLAFCRLAVQAHGGRIWVESDGQVGSTFKFMLPVDVDRL